ncbi:MAG TPA: MFS transporter [Thermoanaerobaculia bacterium]
MDLAARWNEFRTGFSRTFWVANTLELFERFSFYGSKIVLAVFLAETVGLGPLGISLVGFYGFAVFCLPTIAGPFVDRFGFRRSLAACFAIFSVGYFLIALAGIPAASGVVASIGPKVWVVGALLVTAIGGSLIKPCIVGTVARTTTRETKSLGYSVYYTLVNVGGWLGPIFASQVRVSAGIAWVLVGASAMSFLLFLSTLAFFTEPEGAPEGERRTLAAVFRDAALVFRNVRFLAFLAILSVFWVMFWQVYDLFPFYVRDVLHVPRFELIGSLEAFSVILLTVPVSALTRRLRPLVAMTASFAFAGSSWVLLLLFPSWQAAAGAMFLLAFGEVLQAPRFYEYVADLAPKDQVGTFMGFAFLPVAVGALLAGPLGSFLVTRYIKGPRGPAGAWITLSAIGLAGTVAMVLYDRFVAGPREA